jgi:hypothetical protein
MIAIQNEFCTEPANTETHIIGTSNSCWDKKIWRIIGLNAFTRNSFIMCG